MPWNGSGVAVLNQNFPADRDAGAPDWVIDADKMDDEFVNVKGMLQNCLTRDGQTAPSADTPWNAKKITGLADATNATDALNRQSGDARFAQLSGSVFTGQQKFADGTVAAPSIAFANEPDCGLYYTSAGAIGFAINGVEKMQWNANGVAVVDGILALVDDPTAGNHVGDRDYNDARYLLASGLGSTTQAYNARLADIATNLSATSGAVEKTGANTFGTFTVSAAGKALIDDASASAQRTTLGLGNAATRNITASTSAPSGGADGDIWLRYQ